jgi:hypothetical protein
MTLMGFKLRVGSEMSNGRQWELEESWDEVEGGNGLRFPSVKLF